MADLAIPSHAGLEVLQIPCGLRNRCNPSNQTCHFHPAWAWLAYRQATKHAQKEAWMVGCPPPISKREKELFMMDFTF